MHSYVVNSLLSIPCMLLKSTVNIQFKFSFRLIMLHKCDVSVGWGAACRKRSRTIIRGYSSNRFLPNWKVHCDLVKVTKSCKGLRFLCTPANEKCTKRLICLPDNSSSFSLTTMCVAKGRIYVHVWISSEDKDRKCNLALFSLRADKITWAFKNREITEGSCRPSK